MFKIDLYLVRSQPHRLRIQRRILTTWLQQLGHQKQQNTKIKILESNNIDRFYHTTPAHVHLINLNRFYFPNTLWHVYDMQTNRYSTMHQTCLGQRSHSLSGTDPWKYSDLYIEGTKAEPILSKFHVVVCRGYSKFAESLKI